MQKEPFFLQKWDSQQSLTHNFYFFNIKTFTDPSELWIFVNYESMELYISDPCKKAQSGPLGPRLCPFYLLQEG